MKGNSMSAEANVGVVGLAAMGGSLARNLAHHGNKVAVFNRTYARTEKLMNEHGGEGEFYPAKTLEEFVDSLVKPRTAIIMVKAGEPTDAMINALADLMEPGDIIVDAGNAYFPDTIRREKEISARGLHFVGCGVSGGEEGALFAADLLRMYTMYAERRGWQLEIVSQNVTELGGVKEVCATVEGDGAWSRLKFEAGTHRVQRVPETESGGRIQTSAATVAVMPEAEETELSIDPKDLQIDTFRSSGAGGQHVNKTESAIRITHLPSGTVVECQDERSQYKNKDRAMKILRSKLYEAEQARQNAEIAATRRSQVGTGDRSGKIRTYNFPQNRVTDHRLTGDSKNFNLAAVINGDLDALIDALTLADQTRRLQEGYEKGE